MEVVKEEELRNYAKKGWTMWQYLQYRKAVKAEAKQFGMSVKEYEKCLGVKK